jgi:hypothetical protein
MSTEEERLLVLKMVGDGLISAKDGTRLLHDLEEAQGGGTATENERLQILNMIADGQVDARAGMKLLNALGPSKGEESAEKEKRARWFRVRVTDMTTGRSKVNMNIPVSLVNVAMKMGARFAPDVDDMQGEIARAVRGGAQGKIIDIEDSEEGEHVEIFIE